LASQVKMLELTVTTVRLLSMCKDKPEKLPKLFMRIKMKMTWELEIKDSCSVMPLMNGIKKHSTHTPIFYLVRLSKKWLS